MYMNFNEFLEDKHPEYLDEGIGSWADSDSRNAGDLHREVWLHSDFENRHGIKRDDNVGGYQTPTGWVKQGQDSNASQQMGLMAQKAAMSGDPENWKQVSAQIYKQMSQERRPAQDNMRQRHPAQDDIDKAKIHDYDQQRSDDSFAPKNPSNFARSRSI